MQSFILLDTTISISLLLSFSNNHLIRVRVKIEEKEAENFSKYTSLVVLSVRGEVLQSSLSEYVVVFDELSSHFTQYVIVPAFFCSMESAAFANFFL